MTTSRSFLIVGAWLAMATVSCVAYAADKSDAQVRLTADEIAKLPAIATGPGTSGLASIRTTVLVGDPLKDGPYTIALFVPANTRIAAHRHRDSRSVVVVAGEWSFGYGDKANDAVKLLGPGGFYTGPAGVAHFARTGNQPATIYISGVGPTDTQYVDASDASRVAPASSH